MDESIWVTTDLKTQARSIPVLSVISGWFQQTGPNGVYMSVNPAVSSDVPRSNANVGRKRSFLLEFDKIPLGDQKRLIDQAGIPYTTAIYSGGKSIHFILKVDKDLSDAEYKEFFVKLHAMTGAQADEATGDPARWSRLPSAFRESTGRQQIVLDVRKTVRYEDLRTILSKPYLEEAWRGSAAFKKLNRVEDPAERGSFRDVVSWYIHQYLGSSYSGNAFVRCPVCAEEGRDNTGDNLHVSGPDMLAHCFSSPDEHNSRLYKAIRELQAQTHAQHFSGASVMDMAVMACE